MPRALSPRELGTLRPNPQRPCEHSPRVPVLALGMKTRATGAARGLGKSVGIAEATGALPTGPCARGSVQRLWSQAPGSPPRLHRRPGAHVSSAARGSLDGGGRCSRRQGWLCSPVPAASPPSAPPQARPVTPWWLPASRPARPGEDKLSGGLSSLPSPSGADLPAAARPALTCSPAAGLGGPPPAAWPGRRRHLRQPRRANSC